MNYLFITLVGYIINGFFILKSHSQGNQCSIDEIEYYDERICDKFNFGTCTATRVVQRTRTVRKVSCCAGWAGPNCNTAICSPECRNGGTCIGPNKCRCPPGVKGDICNGGCSSIAKVDVIFMIDESGSVGQSSFHSTLESLAKTVDQLAIRDDLIRVGMGLFKSSSRTRFNLNYSYNKGTIKSRIRGTKFGAGGTNIGKAVRYACEDMFVPSKGDRPTAQNVLVLLTDGQSSEDKQSALAVCKSKDVKIIAVGIGTGINGQQLRDLVSKPKYFFTTTYQAIETKLRELVSQSVDCSSFDQSCSHRQPCFPGQCGKAYSCICSAGFAGPSCLKLTSDQFKPTIEKSNASFIQFSHDKGIEEYRYMADATGKSETDITWTNQEKFNTIMLNVEASLNSAHRFSGIPRTPYYIGEFKLGIVDAKMSVLHEKLSQAGRTISTNKTHQCGGLSTLSPIADTVMRCIINDTNDVQFDSGDRYILRFQVTTGGYRKLIDLDRTIIKKEFYSGVSRENVMEFRFDYTEPVHCIEDNTCSGNEVPLTLENEITKSPLKPKWSGWKDSLSGLNKYSFEVWKMEYSLDKQMLKEPSINRTYNPVPDFITEVKAIGSITFPTYEPESPGVYSTILEVNDKANNSKYARRIAIFDKTSSITISKSHPLFVSSASNDANYSWQTNLNSHITLTWQNHFVNEVHERGHFLAAVSDYEARLSDGVKRKYYKKVLQAFDDVDGRRTKSAIKNFNSIVRFKTQVASLNADGSAPNIISQWNDVIPLAESKTIDLGKRVSDGDSFRFWIKAFDIMGNEKEDSTVLHFDSSGPILKQPEVNFNVKDGKYPFSTRVKVPAEDIDSGLKKVSFKFHVQGTNEVKKEQDFNILPKDDCTIENCYCVPNGECYPKIVELDINNCWLKVSKENIAKDVLIMDVVAYNSAMLFAKKIEKFGKVDKLDGIQQYFSPSDIVIEKKSATSLSIKWTQAPTCYERAGIILRLFHTDNTSEEYQIHKEATTFDLTGLTPTTSYWFEMFTKYGNDTHYVKSVDPAVFSFVTAEEAEGFPPAAAGGMAGGLIFLLILAVVVMFILGRTGRLQPAKRRVTSGIRTIRNTIKVREINSGYNNRAVASKEDDDIYFYGGMDMIAVQNWTISRKDVALESEIARGRFAIIYLAKYYSQTEEKTCVAKTLIEDENEEAIVKMRAKINFYGSKVGHHKNVLDFIGSVEDEIRGPMMLLEYCEQGVLKDFLEKSRSQATVDLDERLCRIIFGICHGMDYLASRQVVHRRLAARNILLDGQYEPKIGGFGPDPNTETDNASVAERIPIRWMAPECMKSTKNANELSDVWSFGIVMWETFSLGETPYPNIQSRDVLGKIRQGYKMKKPEYCDDAFYAVMLKCWHYDPRKRLGFGQIKEQLNSMFTEAAGDDYYYYSRNDLLN